MNKRLRTAAFWWLLAAWTAAGSAQEAILPGASPVLAPGGLPQGREPLTFKRVARRTAPRSAVSGPPRP